MDVTITLKNGEVLKLKTVKKDLMLIMLEGGYTLTANYKLYRRKGNVLCGEEVPYKSLDIHIENK